jgi:hypothetical protein
MHAVKIPTGKTLSREQKKASFELWKAKVPLKEIRSHIQMAEITLSRILTLAKNNPDDPCPDQKAGSGKRFKVSEEPRRLQKLLTERGENLSLYVSCALERESVLTL